MFLSKLTSAMASKAHARCKRGGRVSQQGEGEIKRLVTAALVIITIVFAATGFKDSGAETSTPIGQSTPAGQTAAPEGCPYARLGVVFYRSRFTYWTVQRGDTVPSWRRPRNCADARYLAVVWSQRSYRSRQQTELYWEEIRRHTLTDGSWLHAVDVVQRVFPGTESWLLSCSDAESNHHHWVGYSGVPYSDHLRDSNTVGGYMQFRFRTFKGMFRHGLDHVEARGYLVPSHIRGESLEAQTRAWRSALGQAIAAGWARYTGNDNSHWSASWGNGC